MNIQQKVLDKKITVLEIITEYLDSDCKNIECSNSIDCI